MEKLQREQRFTISQNKTEIHEGAFETTGFFAHIVTVDSRIEYGKASSQMP